MNGIKAVVREVYGLFVDDGAFALAIVVWLAMSLTMAGRLGVWGGPVLFSGLAVVLSVSAIRFGRRG